MAGPNKLVIQIEEQIRVWANNRKVYPGWLITPYSNRETLWRHTERWIEPILQAAPSKPLVDRFGMLFELNWRLEKCLVPLFPDLAKLVAETLQQIDPFPNALEIPGASLQFKLGDPQPIDWPFIRNGWINLGLALLRFAREIQDEPTFIKWTTHFKAIEREQRDLHSRLRYEQCLFALGRMDHASVRAALNGWLVDTEDPFWLIRRAAILAEIGEASKAEELADTGLITIRSKIRPGIDDVGALSREGWAMMLMHGLKLRHWLNNKQAKEDLRGRWDKLAKVRCNPHPDLELLEAKLKQPVPHEQEPETEKIGFDPGRITKTIHLGSKGLWPRLLPALQIIRLVEEGAYPPKCGHVVLSGKLLLRAAEWLQADLPQAAMSVLLRVADSKAIESFFTRHRIASLSSKSVEVLYSLTLQALSHAVATLSSLGKGVKTDEQLFYIERVRVAAELLSRIIVRLSDSQVEQELDRALQFYRSEDFARRHMLHEVLRALFKRILVTMPKERISENLLKLASLPIPGANGFQIAWVEGWDDPVAFLSQRVPPPSRNDNPHEWKETIQFLLRIAGSEQHDTRRRAIFRLGKLHDIGCLSEDENQRFGEVLWHFKDSRSGLPSDTGFYDHAVLQLPEPAPSMALDTFKKYYLGLELRPIKQITTQPGGQVVEQYKILTDAGRMLEEFVGATATLQQKPSGEAVKLIDWTLEEVREIFEKIMTWWSLERQFLSRERIDPFYEDELQARIRAVLKALRIVIIPRCQQDSELAERIKSLVMEIEKCGFPVETVLPSLLKIMPSMLEEVAARFRKQIVSPDKEKAHAVLGGLYLWLVGTKSESIAPPPNDLLQELGSIIQGRRQPALEWALFYAANIVRELPECIDEIFAEAVCIGLQYLLEETDYRERVEDISLHIPYAMVPRYRELSAQLAAALSHTSYAKNPVVQQWLAAICNDPLPEVRRVAM